MKLIFTRRFVKATERLPWNIQGALTKQLVLLAESTRDPRLHTKQLMPPLADMYSFRVGQQYRVLFTYGGQTTITLHNVDHRKDIYR